jgi:ABC-2 type transport system ATP-binding protein
MIHVKNLSKKFTIVKSGSGLKSLFKQEKQEIQALNDVSLDIHSGEFVALLGPNGAGKSTFIKILIGVLAKTAGQVQVLGVDPLEKRLQITNRLGVVFGQRSRLWHDLPVKDSFDLTRKLYLEPRNQKSAEQKAWEKFLFDSIDINDLLEYPVKKLSLGQKMRCELVNTLLYNPELIFLDEPTIGLDVISKQKIREALKLLHSNGKTIVLTSHDTGDIEQLCQRIVIINHGQVALDKSVTEFIKLQKNTEVTILPSETISETVFDSLRASFLDLEYRFMEDSRLQLTIPRTQLTDLLIQVFKHISIKDIQLDNESVENILADIYSKPNLK